MSVIRRLNDRGIYLVHPTILTVDKEQFTEDEYPSDDETDTGATKTFTCSKGARWVRHMPTTLAQTSEQSMAMQAGDYVYLAGPMTSPLPVGSAQPATSVAGPSFAGRSGYNCSTLAATPRRTAALRPPEPPTKPLPPQPPLTELPPTEPPPPSRSKM